MTLKFQGDFPGGAFERGEVEVSCPGSEPDLALFGPDDAEMLAGIVRDQKLVTVYETNIRRILRTVTSDSSTIEVAFDAGFVSAGGQKLPIREIELKLKSGDPGELYRLGMAPYRTTMLCYARGTNSKRPPKDRLLNKGSPLREPDAIVRRPWIAGPDNRYSHARRRCRTCWHRIHSARHWLQSVPPDPDWQ
jgi:hypothetical protein